MMRISSRSLMRPNCVVGAFPCSRSLSVGSRLSDWILYNGNVEVRAPNGITGWISRGDVSY
jgi:hypothetical protein